MIDMVVVLYLSVSDTWTGELLYKKERVINEFSVSGDPFKDLQNCLARGVPEVLRIVNAFREHGRPHASGNVSCKWEKGERT